MSHRLPERDRPWMIRTYAGHSTAAKSNELYRRNLAKGQTGLSVAFDLPTQTGYDADHELARGEVGKVGVPVAHRGDMAALLDGIPLGEMNTSMTINATAAWLLALYIVAAEEQGVAMRVALGDDPERHHQGVPLARDLRVPARAVDAADRRHGRLHGRARPDVEPGQHLLVPPAGGGRDARCRRSRSRWRPRWPCSTRSRARVAEDRMTAVFGRISFFVNAGVRFIEEHAKLRAMSVLWEELGRSRYGVTDSRALRFRYGVQVNSLGLTESQPENNVQRIVLEALAVTLGRGARARAVQLPAWNEALGLPRPWDQQWSLRIQQVLAYETDLLEYPDIFEGSVVMDGLVGELLEGARAELARVEERGGAVEAVPYMKSALVESHRERIARIEDGSQVLVGVNRFTETEPSPLTAEDGGILVVDPGVEAEARAALESWRGARGDVSAELDELRRVAASDENIMDATLAAARAGVTTGEWAGALRDVFGSYRAPTGVGHAASPAADEALRDEVARVSEALGRTLKILVGKPGLDGHSNGAEQIAVRARDAGMDVVYEGIRLTPAQIARSAIDEGVHVIGLSILSGSHRELIPDVIAALDGADIPVVVGGIIPDADVPELKAAGVAAVYTPKDFELDRIMRDIVALVAERNSVKV